MKWSCSRTFSFSAGLVFAHNFSGAPLCRGSRKHDWPLWEAAYRRWTQRMH